MGIQHCGKFKFWYNKFILNWRGQKNGIYKAIGDNRYIFTEWDIWKYPDKWNYYHERTLTTHLRKTSWRLKFIQKIWTKQCTKSWYYYKRWKNQGTIFMVKKLPDTNLNVVVRVVLETDEIGWKNSVMTFYRIREKNLKKLIKKNTLLYKKE